MRRATQDLLTVDDHSKISIHALLAESDWTAPCSPTGCEYFYPRSPCGERPITEDAAREWAEFLSTLSLRRATRKPGFQPALRKFLSTLSLRRATSCRTLYSTPPRNFYPRSPCGERRLWRRIPSCRSDFYPRSPCGERRPISQKLHPQTFISIHALLAESDSTGDYLTANETNFYPRSPCGERPGRLPSPGQAGQDFYPRSPCGERQIPYAVSELVLEFLSTLSLRRATLVTALCSHSHPHFYPRSPCGERRVVQPRQSPTD